MSGNINRLGEILGSEKAAAIFILLVHPCQPVKLILGLQRSVSLLRQGVAALYRWDGEFAFYANKMEVFLYLLGVGYVYYFSGDVEYSSVGVGWNEDSVDY